MAGSFVPTEKQVELCLARSFVLVLLAISEACVARRVGLTTWRVVRAAIICVGLCATLVTSMKIDSAQFRHRVTSVNGTQCYRVSGVANLGMVLSQVAWQTQDLTCYVTPEKCSIRLVGKTGVYWQAGAGDYANKICQVQDLKAYNCKRASLVCTGKEDVIYLLDAKLISREHLTNIAETLEVVSNEVISTNSFHVERDFMGVHFSAVYTIYNEVSVTTVMTAFYQEPPKPTKLNHWRNHFGIPSPACEAKKTFTNGHIIATCLGGEKDFINCQPESQYVNGILKQRFENGLDKLRLKLYGYRALSIVSNSETTYADEFVHWYQYKDSSETCMVKFTQDSISSIFCSDVRAMLYGGSFNIPAIISYWQRQISDGWERNVAAWVSDYTGYDYYHMRDSVAVRIGTSAFKMLYNGVTVTIGKTGDYLYGVVMAVPNVVTHVTSKVFSSSYRFASSFSHLEEDVGDEMWSVLETLYETVNSTQLILIGCEETLRERALCDRLVNIIIMAWNSYDYSTTHKSLDNATSMDKDTTLSKTEQEPKSYMTTLS